MNDHKDDASTDKERSDSAGTGVGTAVGAAAGGVAGGAAAGALAGGVTGPVGAVLGAAVGALAGAMTRERRPVDPVLEDTFWSHNFASRPYVNSGSKYEDYQPAYRHGMDAYAKYPDRSFDEAEPDMARDWNHARGNSPLEWEHARHASRDAWHRVSSSAERTVPGDSDGDGR